MAYTPMVLVASFLNLGGTDVSSYTSKVEVQLMVEDKDVTTFGSGGWKQLLGGLKSGNINITWKNDVTVGDLDSILWGFGLGSLQTFEVRASNAARSTSNPAYLGSVLVDQLTPIGGAVGDVNEQSVGYPTSGAVTRATS